MNLSRSTSPFFLASLFVLLGPGAFGGAQGTESFLDPAPGAQGAYPDGNLSIAFDHPPVLAPGGQVEILDTQGKVVDTIHFVNEVQRVGGVAIRVGGQLARVVGNSLVITPHFDGLHYATTYSVRLPADSLQGSWQGRPFRGVGPGTDIPWSFTTRSAPVLTAQISVDGSSQGASDFRSLGAALRHLANQPVAGASVVTISVAPGTYHELLYYKSQAANPGLTILLEGPSGSPQGAPCVFEFANGNALNPSTQTRSTFYFTGANLVVQNLSFVNPAPRQTVGQAETLYFASGPGFTLAALQCSFRSHQDTLQTSGRNWFWNCFIEGNVDMVWGRADAALFQDCRLHVVADGAPSVSLVVARTGSLQATTVGKGYVFADSEVSIDAGVTASYGRRAGTSADYDQVAWVHNRFTGAGSLSPGLWATATAPHSLGDSSVVGWKAAGNTGLGAETLAVQTAPGSADLIDQQARHWMSRDQILNERIALDPTHRTPVGYEPAPDRWDTGALAAQCGAPPGDAAF